MHEQPRVFISYSSDEAPLVRQFEAELREAGIETWVDQRRLRAGDNLPVEISEALSWCNVLLLVWSKSSSQSNWVKLEWTNAVALDKRIVPLLLDDTPLPSILSHKTYISSKNPDQRKSELLRALSKQPESDGASVRKHAQKKRTWPQTTKRLLMPVGAVLMFVAVLGVAILTAKYFWRTDSGASPANSPTPGLGIPGSSGSSHQKLTVLLMIVDFSSSLTKFQAEQVVNNANTILNEMPVGTSYEIYKLQANWNLATTLEAGTVQRLTNGGKVQQERTRRLESAKNEPHFGNTSCLIDSLPFAQRFFKQYDPNEYQYELVYLSDMVEDCSSPLVDRKLTVSNVQANGLQFPEPVDLSDVHITAIIPTLEPNPPRPNKSPPLSELRVLWREIFKHCGVTEARLSKDEWFYFSTFLPIRFRAA